MGTGPTQANEDAGHLFLFRGKWIQRSNKGTEIFRGGGWVGDGGNTPGGLGSQGASTDGTSEARCLPGAGKWHLHEH